MMHTTTIQPDVPSPININDSKDDNTNMNAMAITTIEGMDTVHKHAAEALILDSLSADDEDDDIPPSEKLMMEEERSFYSNSENNDGDDNIWGLLSGVGGNIYEWYDFAVYGLLAPEIGSSFFPQASRELQLINSFGVYLAAFLMRPLGAIMFGEMGDRILGRKNALVVSIILITVPSVAMGLLPTYDMIGKAAPICLVILRMLQGLSVGGQLAGSYVLSIEQSSSSSRGFRGSVCDASSVGGFLLASAVTTIVRKCLSEEAVNNWGWRIPFWFSLLLAPMLFFIVNNTEESKLWSERNEQKETEQLIREREETTQPAIVDLFGSPFRRRQLAGMVGTLCSMSSGFYTLFLWTPVYLSELRGLMSEADADLLNFVVVGAYIFFLLMAGKISDQFPHRMDLMRIGIQGMIIACPAMFGIFESESWYGYLIGQLQFAFVLALVEGGKAAWEVELWMADPSLSFTGVAIGHNLSSTLFGGTMPLVATFLFYKANTLVVDDDDALFPRLVPGLYISILGCVSLYCVSFVVRHPHDVRTGDTKLREALQREDRKFRKAKKAKDRKRAIEKQLGQGAARGTDIWSSPVNSFNFGDANLQYIPPSSS